MKHAGFGLAMVVAGALSCAGCAPLLIGAGAAAGYAISKDAVRNQFEISPDAAFRHSLAVARDAGLVTMEDEAAGKIKVKVQSSTVVITIKPATRRTVDLKVSARNELLMPDLDTALALFNKITERF